jgi:hypothetical protein
LGENSSHLVTLLPVNLQSAWWLTKAAKISSRDAKNKMVPRNGSVGLPAERCGRMYRSVWRRRQRPGILYIFDLTSQSTKTLAVQSCTQRRPSCGAIKSSSLWQDSMFRSTGFSKQPNLGKLSLGTKYWERSRIFFLDFFGGKKFFWNSLSRVRLPTD